MPVFLSNGLFFSELLVDNAGGSAFDTDGDGGANKADEFVEIQSFTGAETDLSTIQIWSAQRGLLFDFDPGDTTNPSGVATVVGQFDGPEPDGFFDAGLPDNSSNQGFLEDGEANRFDTIYLVDTATGEFISLTYGDPPQTQPLPAGFPGTTSLGGEVLVSNGPNGVPFNRDANGNLQEGTTPTPGVGGPVCYLAGTLIETADGQRPVETLTADCLIVTRDRGLQPLRWLGHCHLASPDLAQRPKLRPIRIAKGALGAGLPNRDLFVSPQHRMFIQSRISARMFGHDGVLVPAVKLLGLPGITRVEDAREVAYYHVLFDQHEIVFAEGCASESLLLGPMAKQSLGPDALEEIAALFPGALDDIPVVPAREIPAPKQIRKLVQRHANNHKRALVEAA